MPPFTFNLCQNGIFFGSFHFGFSSCRHFVDSLKRVSSRIPVLSAGVCSDPGILIDDALVIRCFVIHEIAVVIEAKQR